MLKNWQEKYPQIFASYPDIMSKLTANAQNSLDEMLIHFMNVGHLNEKTIHFLLKLYSSEVDLVLIQKFLSNQIVMNGLNDALTLFNHSQFTYKQEYFNAFALLTSVLANPLCQIIFEARLRCFSDYSSPSEPLRHPKIADSIIQQLNKLDSQEERIAVFFDFFTDYRPFPNSQCYIVEINVEMEVELALGTYCLAQIAMISNKQDYLRTKQLLEKINTKGGSIDLFNEIKYQVAYAIEDKDMCSTRDYQKHMTDIHQALMHHQFKLDFTEKLQKSKGYQEMLTTRMQGHALLVPSSDKAQEHAMEEEVVVANSKLS